METTHNQEIPGRVKIIPGKGGLPAFHVGTDWSVAEIYLHGAHVTRFQKNGEAPLLFLSDAGEFQSNKPIRGGVPLIFPWFGPREGMAAHGFARVADWDLLETRVLPDGSIRLHFRLPPDDECQVDYSVTVGTLLTLELAVSNISHADFTFENCLHTYFHVGDIRQIEITGLQGTRYHDLLLAAEFTETGESIRIAGEVDRTYQDSAATVEIRDPVLHRTLRVRKSGSKSTVVWNPWLAKSQRMPDFGDDEYLQMVCVESGNIAENAVTISPGQCSSLIVEIDSQPLA
jgi:D-hexose-6-phosphate mutarotase